MYDFAKQRNTLFCWGRYYEKAPSLPMSEPGKPFRFSWSPVEHSMDDMVVGMEHHATTSSISTTYDCNWSIEGFILIDGELWKIIRMSFEHLHGERASLLRRGDKRWSISIQKIDNPIGLSSS